MDIFGLVIAVPIENVQEIWPTKMDFGRPNAEIGQKMTNGRLLFLALLAISALCLVLYFPYSTGKNDLTIIYIKTSGSESRPREVELMHAFKKTR